MFSAKSPMVSTSFHLLRTTWHLYHIAKLFYLTYFIYFLIIIYINIFFHNQTLVLANYNDVKGELTIAIHHATLTQQENRRLSNYYQHADTKERS